MSKKTKDIIFGAALGVGLALCGATLLTWQFWVACIGINIIHHWPAE